ncbi:hypothetical protein GYH30_006749 [Glycine max]|uniref:SAC domain-containing protein n=2 Tax=Glycine subgen. Soja TaxID=1462606 RepID=K7KE16_SOYBN|nr:hypothetical protein GYH30_006749 [Glycine max]
MLEVLIDNKQLEPYLLPVVQGRFHHFQAAIGKDIIDVTFIASRCTTRNVNGYFSCDSESNHENCMQLHYFDGYIASFVQLLQVRGSIPLLWQQIVDLTYKPKLSY